MNSKWLRLLYHAIPMMVAGVAQAVNFNCSLAIAPAYSQVLFGNRQFFDRAVGDCNLPKDRRLWCKNDQFHGHAQQRTERERRAEPGGEPNASNQHIPMLMTNSLRTQDTLHNAVLAARPVMSAIAVNQRRQRQREAD